MQHADQILKRGFTLIELSIVLVIIGLIVGGVLVGQDLIRAAGVRATISQIERFNTAVNTFRGKYGYLPGDIKDPEASSFGFQTRGTSCAGQGDGNGIIQGVYSPNCSVDITLQAEGETVTFWVDLSGAHLIEGGFSAGSETVYPGALTTTSTPGIAQFFPAAKLGRGNYIYVYGGTSWNGSAGVPTGLNYFSLSAITLASTTFYSAPALTVAEASSIDAKIDDGFPQTGRVTATYQDRSAAASLTWSAGLPFTFGPGYANPLTSTAAQPGSSSTCWDNGNVGGQPQRYSVEISSGSNVNCALSFQMQAGD